MLDRTHHSGSSRILPFVGVCGTWIWQMLCSLRIHHVATILESVRGRSFLSAIRRQALEGQEQYEQSFCACIQHQGRGSRRHLHQDSSWLSNRMCTRYPGFEWRISFPALKIWAVLPLSRTESRGSKTRISHVAALGVNDKCEQSVICCKK